MKDTLQSYFIQLSILQEYAQVVHHHELLLGGIPRPISSDAQILSDWLLEHNITPLKYNDMQRDMPRNMPKGGKADMWFSSQIDRNAEWTTWIQMFLRQIQEHLPEPPVERIT